MTAPNITKPIIEVNNSGNNSRTDDTIIRNACQIFNLSTKYHSIKALIATNPANVEIKAIKASSKLAFTNNNSGLYTKNIGNIKPGNARLVACKAVFK